jgi:hypothetical protein
VQTAAKIDARIAAFGIIHLNSNLSQIAIVWTNRDGDC